MVEASAKYHFVASLGDEQKEGTSRSDEKTQAKKKSRSLVRYDTVDEFEEHEMQAKDLPVSWTQLKVN